jgi:hypothetical protein
LGIYSKGVYTSLTVDPWALNTDATAGLRDVLDGAIPLPSSALQDHASVPLGPSGLLKVGIWTSWKHLRSGWSRSRAGNPRSRALWWRRRCALGRDRTGFDEGGELVDMRKPLVAVGVRRAATE